jgi:lysophospholipase L1-like esterase
MAAMRRGLGRLRNVLRLGSVVSIVATAGVVAPTLTASASAPPVTGNARNGTYLALGDSVAFGYVPAQASPAPNYYDAHSFVSYANDVAQALDERVFNASCPGETTGSMLYAGAQSNGCENSVTSPIGYRTLYPLHVEYQGTQTAYAVQFLTDHKHTNLVTIDIGANDAFVCEATTTDHCSSPTELAQVGEEVETNLGAIFTQIRDTAHYAGPVVVLDYYSLTYATATDNFLSALLNSFVNAAAAPFTAIVADGFTAFETASAGSGGSPCAAGLLIPVPGGCNIHPTHLGHQVLADAILEALTAAGY